MVRSMTQLDLDIAKNIKAFRVAKELTISKMAESLGVSYQQLHKYETGQNKVSVSRLHQIAKVLEVDISQLFASRADCDTKTLIANIKLVKKLSTIKNLDLLNSLTKHIEALCVELKK